MAAVGGDKTVLAPAAVLLPAIRPVHRKAGFQRKDIFGKQSLRRDGIGGMGARHLQQGHVIATDLLSAHHAAETAVVTACAVKCQKESGSCQL